MMDVFDSAKFLVNFLNVLGFFPLKISKNSMKYSVPGIIFAICNLLLVCVFIYFNIKNDSPWDSKSIMLSIGWLIISQYSLFTLIIMHTYQLCKLGSLERFFLLTQDFDQLVNVLFKKPNKYFLKSVFSDMGIQHEM